MDHFYFYFIQFQFNSMKDDEIKRILQKTYNLNSIELESEWKRLKTKYNDETPTFEVKRTRTDKDPDTKKKKGDIFDNVKDEIQTWFRPRKDQTPCLENPYTPKIDDFWSDANTEIRASIFKDLVLTTRHIVFGALMPEEYICNILRVCQANELKTVAMGWIFDENEKLSHLLRGVDALIIYIHNGCEASDIKGAFELLLHFIGRLSDINTLMIQDVDVKNLIPKDEIDRIKGRVSQKVKLRAIKARKFKFVKLSALFIQYVRETWDVRYNIREDWIDFQGLGKLEIPCYVDEKLSGLLKGCGSVIIKDNVNITPHFLHVSIFDHSNIYFDAETFTRWGVRLKYTEAPIKINVLRLICDTSHEKIHKSFGHVTNGFFLVDSLILHCDMVNGFKYPDECAIDFIHAFNPKHVYLDGWPDVIQIFGFEQSRCESVQFRNCAVPSLLRRNLIEEMWHSIKFEWIQCEVFEPSHSLWDTRDFYNLDRSSSKNILRISSDLLRQKEKDKNLPLPSCGMPEDFSVLDGLGEMYDIERVNSKSITHFYDSDLDLTGLDMWSPEEIRACPAFGKKWGVMKYNWNKIIGKEILERK